VSNGNGTKVLRGEPPANTASRIDQAIAEAQKVYAKYGAPFEFQDRVHIRHCMLMDDIERAFDRLKMWLEARPVRGPHSVSPEEHARTQARLDAQDRKVAEKDRAKAASQAFGRVTARGGWESQVRGANRAIAVDAYSDRMGGVVDAYGTEDIDIGDLEHENAQLETPGATSMWKMA